MIFVDFTFLDIEPIFDPIQGDCLTVPSCRGLGGAELVLLRYQQMRHVSSGVAEAGKLI